jgi:hypothetical protein
VKVSSDNIIAADGFAVAEFTMSGTQSGAIGPLKASKIPLAFHGVDIVETKDGKAIKGETFGNSFEILGQRNLLPKPKAAKTEGAKAEGDKGDKKADKKADKPEKAEKGDKGDKGDKKADAPKDKPASDKK